MTLRVLANTLELRQVEATLRAGMNRQEIADALGVTRQAVQKKYAKRLDPSIVVPTDEHEQVHPLRGNYLRESDLEELFLALTLNAQPAGQALRSWGSPSRLHVQQ